MSCFMCHESLYLSHHGLCCYCTAQLLKQPKASCPRCGLLKLATKITCKTCQIVPPIWHWLFSVNEYHSPLGYFINLVKYQRKLSYLPMLARLLLLRYLDERRKYRLSLPDQILSVPLSRQRLLSRGFNQAELLAKLLRYWLHIADLHYPLKKIKHTPSQQGLDQLARQKNLQGAFHCTDTLTQQRILLIDDIVTTGHTIKNVSQCLAQQGAAQIVILCLCRTL